MFKSKLKSLAALLLLTTAANSATLTDAFTVRLTINASCSMSVQDLDFGVANSTLAAEITANTYFKVSCTNGTPFAIGIDKGTYGTATNDRKMSAGGSELVKYGLYIDTGMTQNWGNATGVDEYTGVGDGNTFALYVYGKVFTQSTPTSGDYSDKLVVTLNY